MTTMTLDRTTDVGWVDESGLRELHMRQLAELFEGRHGAERAAMAHAYAHLLAEFEREVRAIRNVEVARMADGGAGPSAIGRAFGVQRARGDQIARSANASREHDDKVVGQLRRRLAQWRKDNLT